MPEKDKNSQEGPDVRGNLIKVNVGGDTIFVDSNIGNLKILNHKNGYRKNILSIKLRTINHLTLLMGKALDAVYM